MINEAIRKLSLKKDLTEDEARMVINQIMNREATSSQIGAFLLGLKIKGETTDEILGTIRALRENMIKIDVDRNNLIDTCGTGGDGGKTFNISTASAIIAASGGVKVAKHGNRAISSKSGSADVLKELGIDINMKKEDSERDILNKGMSFLFAPNYHNAMRNVANERAELKIRTIFNLVGPLSNPAPLTGQLLGVYDDKVMKTIAEVLAKLGLNRALIVHGDDGLDEITTTTTTSIYEVTLGEIKNYKLNPENLGIKKASLKDISGGNPKENSKIILDILKGNKGPKRDIVVLNSAAALYVGEIVDSIEEGIIKAKFLIDSGLAYKKYIQLSNKEVS
ncbi:anthranilate phosphoribosyltransferase [Clostridium sartagoforme]|uniref:Anthranilate phosphoribosyltransferase n=1 Tax=Clostridium sartagoforme TaxID=84031 RepID=A0A4S2DJ62_9CLOT|nr:anthranilate phosphoribosyltransferase [Clostridium sartagoforme]TGY40934.1 anthranilate phosphoribosyltransferase [Clostridium sartagoforme]